MKKSKSQIRDMRLLSGYAFVECVLKKEFGVAKKIVNKAGRELWNESLVYKIITKFFPNGVEFVVFEVCEIDEGRVSIVLGSEDPSKWDPPRIYPEVLRGISLVVVREGEDWLVDLPEFLNLYSKVNEPYIIMFHNCQDEKRRALLTTALETKRGILDATAIKQLNLSYKYFSQRSNPNPKLD
jgi:hypothetical protein